MLSKEQMNQIYFYSERGPLRMGMDEHEGSKIIAATGDHLPLNQLLGLAEAFTARHLPEEPKVPHCPKCWYSYAEFTPCCCPLTPKGVAARARADAIRLIGKRVGVHYTAEDGGPGYRPGTIWAVGDSFQGKCRLQFEGGTAIPLADLLSVEEI